MNLAFAPRSTKVACKILVRPKLEYAAPILSPYCKIQIQQVEKVQRTAARWTSRRCRNTSSDGEMLYELQWPTLEARRDQSSLLFFHKIQEEFRALIKMTQPEGVFFFKNLKHSPQIMIIYDQHVQQLEQLQRSIMKRIQCLPVGTATSAAYGLLSIRPIQQELDIRKLTLLGNVLLNKNTLEFEIAQRQLAVKSIESKSWFADCNLLLYKYNLPNIYHVIDNIESFEGWKVLIKKQIDSYVKKRVGAGCKGLITMAEYAVHACRTGSPSMEINSP